MQKRLQFDTLATQLLSQIEEALLLYGSNDVIVYANEPASVLFRLSADELVNQPVLSILPNLANAAPYSKKFLLPVTIDSQRTLLECKRFSVQADGTDYHVLTAYPAEFSALEQGESAPSERMITEPAVNWFWEMDAHLAFTHFSERIYEITGYTKEELIGQERRNVVSQKWLSENREAWASHLKTINAHRSFQNFEYVLIRKDQSEITIQISGDPVFDRQGNFTGYLGIGWGIVSKPAPDTLIDTDKNQIHHLLESSPIGVGITSRSNSIIEFANRRLDEIFQEKPGGMVGKQAEQLWANLKEREYFLNQFDDKGRVGGKEVELKRANGEVFWALLTWETVNLRGLRGILFWIYDIDPQKIAQRKLEESEQRFKNIAESASDWFWEMGPDLRFTFLSDRFYDVMGANPEDIIGKTRAEIAGARQIALESEKWKEHLDDLEQHWPFRDFVYQLDSEDGGGRYLKLSGCPFYSPSGKFMGYRGAGTDVTAEELLRISEEHHRTMLNTTKEGFLSLDSDNQILEANPAFCAMIGYTEEELRKAPQSSWVNRLNHIHITKQLGLLKQTRNRTFEAEITRKDGSSVPILINATALKDREENWSSFAFISDLTEQKHTAEELRKHRDQLEGLIKKRTKDLEESNKRLIQEIHEREEITQRLEASETRLSQIINFLPEATFVIDTSGVVIAWNQAMENMTGIRAQQILGKGDYEYAVPFYGERRPVMIDLLSDWNEEIAKKYRGICQEGDTLSSETDVKSGPGAGMVLWNSARPLYNQSGEVVGAIEVIRDITALKQTESDLIKAQQYIENIFDSLPSILIGVDQDGIVTQWNKTAEKETGTIAARAMGQHLSMVAPQLWKQTEQIERSLQTGEPQAVRITLQDNSTTQKYLDVSVYPLSQNKLQGAVIRVDDVTERVQIEEVIVQSEKMLSVGGLAAGMAHEINNPLAGILQNMQVIKSRLTTEQKKNLIIAEQCGITMDQLQQYIKGRGIDHMMDAVMESSRRAASIVHNMLSFSRKGHTDREPVDLATLIDNTLDLAANDYDLKRRYDFRHIEIIREYENNLPHVLCQSSEIQQVIFNLLRNGAHAMMSIEQPKSHFIIRLHRKQNFVQLEVEDNGPGMDEQTRKRIFEPFFTTKDVGVGTGLGLSVSYFIITENHKGSMTVESAPAKGCKFTIQLPI